MRSTKPKIGDVFEIRTLRGLAYLQYTHEHTDLGQLVRILPGLYEIRPDVTKLVQQKELYFAFYLLDYALRDRSVEISSNELIPEWAKPFPVMRRRVQDGWQIADGSKRLTMDETKRMTRVRQLTPEQRKLSLGWELWPHPVMVKQLTRGWTPEREEEFRRIDTAEAERKRAAEADQSKEAKGSVLDHYLYFPRKKDAETAAKRLRNKGWGVQVRLGGDRQNWLVLAKELAPTDDDVGNVRDQLEDLAQELHGEYDGWGAPL